MFNAQKPDPSELPSAGRLLASTGVAALGAGALLVLIVLPAEYGVDPTGAGSVLGLTDMGRIKMQLASEAAEDAADVPTPEPVPGPSSPAAEPPSAAAPAAGPSSSAPSSRPVMMQDERIVFLAPDAGHEIKLEMQKGARVQFEWFTDGPGVNFDTHADGAGIRYHGYEKGRNTPRQSGELVAAFDGRHGWFWRNRSGQPLTLTLRVEGDYSAVKDDR
jgi:hypothetical protein